MVFWDPLTIPISCVSLRHACAADKETQQRKLARNQDPVLISADINRKSEALDRMCKYIATRPAPPKVVPAPAPKPAEAEPAPMESEPSTEAAPEAAAEAVPEGIPMDL